VAEGYHTLQFAGAGDDYPVRQEIKAMYKEQGKEPPKEMDDTVVYNRGILWAAVRYLNVPAISVAVIAFLSRRSSDRCPLRILRSTPTGGRPLPGFG
jgi:hypothetical protein